jgi:hypothetical protein
MSDMPHDEERDTYLADGLVIFIRRQPFAHDRLVTSPVDADFHALIRRP